MTTIKDRTLQKSNIHLVEGFHRFINTEDRLATTGFKDKKVLWENRHSFRFDENAIRRMNERYAEIYNKHLVTEAAVEIFKEGAKSFVEKHLLSTQFAMCDRPSGLDLLVDWLISDILDCSEEINSATIDTHYRYFVEKSIESLLNQ